MAISVKLPVLTGDWEKDKKKIEIFMQQTQNSLRLLEQQIRRERYDGSIKE